MKYGSVTCPRCGSDVSFPDVYLSSEVRCSRCGLKLVPKAIKEQQQKRSSVQKKRPKLVDGPRKGEPFIAWEFKFLVIETGKLKQDLRSSLKILAVCAIVTLVGLRSFRAMEEVNEGHVGTEVSSIVELANGIVILAGIVGACLLVHVCIAGMKMQQRAEELRKHGIWFSSDGKTVYRKEANWFRFAKGELNDPKIYMPRAPTDPP